MSLFFIVVKLTWILCNIIPKCLLFLLKFRLIILVDELFMNYLSNLLLFLLKFWSLHLRYFRVFLELPLLQAIILLSQIVLLWRFLYVLLKMLCIGVNTHFFIISFNFSLVSMVIIYVMINTTIIGLWVHFYLLHLYFY